MGLHLDRIGKDLSGSCSWNEAYNLITREFAIPGRWFYTDLKELILPLTLTEEALYQFAAGWFSYSSQGKIGLQFDILKTIQDEKDMPLSEEDIKLKEAYESGANLSELYVFTEVEPHRKL